jgi:predicted O-methyltransferase YrrM
MLEDYFTHPDSRYYCVDHFQGSPEHHRLNVDCSHLEREARQRLEKFGYRAQILKMDTAHAMKNFLKDLKFDAIYVDASHDAISVLRDTILAWDLLKVGGTMIWDDYEWQVFDQPLDCPRIAIDAFLAIYARRYTILEPKCWQIAVTKTA